MKPDKGGPAPSPSASRLSDQDLYLFNEGSHFGLHDKLGAHVLPADQGVAFGVWAPNASAVSVIGDFNDWKPDRHPLSLRADSGIWEGVVPGIGAGTKYKYRLLSKQDGAVIEKADPFAFAAEVPPHTASIVERLDYDWGDQEWMAGRGPRNALHAPHSVYEVHLGSWRRVPEAGNRSLTYREIAPRLADHARRLGFTHVEILPVMEHPFYGSWGYQTTGYFAPTSRYGSPQDFMFLIDHLHRNGIGVILDWVPSHFPTDAHGLARFDGTHLYEHADVRQGFHPEWKSSIFNYGRHEVRSFLISNAFFWLDRYHVDGLRVDAVASMLYLDYARREGEWIPNEYGGKENLQAVQFLRRLNQEIYRAFPDTQTTAEESTSWPGVSRPLYVGGLGFGRKWDMGWMHDSLAYLAHEPVYRKYHHDHLTFRGLYSFSENFVLPLSHDEVVYGKRSLLKKMPGDDWQQFANLRLLLAWQHAQPGKKLLFMGGEFGQEKEWAHDSSLDWHLAEQASHKGLMSLVADLNRAHRNHPALHEGDHLPTGFEWIDGSDSGQSVVTFLRRSLDHPQVVLAAFNFTPVPRHSYRVGVPQGGFWKEILNTDAAEYGGSGLGNQGGRRAEPQPCHGRPASLDLLLPPLAAVFLVAESETPQTGNSGRPA